MATNFTWTDSRLSSQRPTARTLAAPRPDFPSLGEAVGGGVLGGRRALTLPSWVVFCMIVLATFAVCATVTMRTHAAKLGAAERFVAVSTDVEKLRADNASLQTQVERLRKDPRAVETAARTRMNMVRANEVVIPLE